MDPFNTDFDGVDSVFSKAHNLFFCYFNTMNSKTLFLLLLAFVAGPFVIGQKMKMNGAKGKMMKGCSSNSTSFVCVSCEPR